jgi:hypothetical protein
MRRNADAVGSVTFARMTYAQRPSIWDVKAQGHVCIRLAAQERVERSGARRSCWRRRARAAPRWGEHRKEGARRPYNFVTTPTRPRAAR